MRDKKFGDSDRVSPGIAVLHITDKCNLKCKHCYVIELNDKKHKDSSTKELKIIIDQLDGVMDKHRRSLNLFGGEPTLREDFFELAEHSLKYNFLLFTSTNGTRITKSFAQRLAGYKIRTQVSLDGIDKESHEMILGVGTWEKTMSGIKMLIDAGVDPVLNMVFHSGNIETIPDYIEFAKQLGVKCRFIPISSVGNSLGSSLQYAGMDKMVDIVLNKLRADPDCLERISSSFFVMLLLTLLYCQRCKYCGTGLYTIHIRANGDLYPCANLMIPDFFIGNMLDTSLDYLYENSMILKTLRGLNVDTLNDVCSKCAYKYLCGGGCRGETYQSTKNLFGPYIHCKSWRSAIDKLFWALAEFPALQTMKIDEYLPFIAVGES